MPTKSNQPNRLDWLVRQMTRRKCASEDSSESTDSTYVSQKDDAVYNVEIPTREAEVAFQFARCMAAIPIQEHADCRNPTQHRAQEVTACGMDRQPHRSPI